MRVELVKTFQFEAAHTSKGRLHGHSYVVEVKCSGPCDAVLGWLVDYGEISERFAPLYRQLDHYLLDDVAGMTDTSTTGIESWLDQRLAGSMPHYESVRVRIYGDCAYLPKRIEAADAFGDAAQLRFGFEAAHYLPNLPESHKCRRMHGHSFRLEVASSDLASLEPVLRDVYDALDRTCLNEVAGLDNPTSEQTARWVWDYVRPRVPDLEFVAVAETCTARCIYRGER